MSFLQCVNAYFYLSANSVLFDYEIIVIVSQQSLVPMSNAYIHGKFHRNIYQTKLEAYI